MTQDTALDILKSAILLERRGKAFYAKVAEQTSSQAVREFFGLMADEEERHVQVLSEQYRAHQGTGAFAPHRTGAESPETFASAVLTERLKREIAAAGFEAAAVAAALTMERDALRFYAQRAASAPDPEERALYQWLADWEAGHLDFLARLDHDVTEAVWNDNHFWPF